MAAYLPGIPNRAGAAIERDFRAVSRAWHTASTAASRAVRRRAGSATTLPLGWPERKQGAFHTAAYDLPEARQDGMWTERVSMTARANAHRLPRRLAPGMRSQDQAGSAWMRVRKACCTSWVQGAVMRWGGPHVAGGAGGNAPVATKAGRRRAMADRAPNLQSDPNDTVTPPDVNERSGPLQTIGQTVTGLSALVIFALIATPVGLIAACLAILVFAR